MEIDQIDLYNGNIKIWNYENVFLVFLQMTNQFVVMVLDCIDY